MMPQEVFLSHASADRAFADRVADVLRRHGILLTSLQELYTWGNSNSVWPLNFGLACCAIELMASGAVYHTKEWSAAQAAECGK